jgi:hypothetical protein
LIMYWHILVFLGPADLVASCVTELDDTLPRFTGVQSDSVEATSGALLAHACHVVRFIPMQG